MRIARFVEVPAFDGTGVAFTFRDTRDFDFVAELEALYADFISDLEFGQSFDTKLFQDLRSDSGRFDVARNRLAQILTLTVTQLHSVITVGFDSFNLSHCGGVGLQNRNWSHDTVVADDLGHTNFGADDDLHPVPFPYNNTKSRLLAGSSC